MDSRMEIDFMDLNRKPQLSEMEKQHKKASGMKWPFSSMVGLATQHENTFFQNCNSTPIVSINSKYSSLNNYKSTKDPQYFGGGFPLVAKTSTSNSRKNYEHLRQNESTLTIFYMGEVHIFQNISPHKAAQIIDMVSKSTTLLMDEILEKVMNKEKYEENKSEPSNASTNYAKGALAMARRATLARFLEKRKHRLIKARPYLYGENLSKFPFDIHLEEEETASSSVHWEN
ncbi:protein JAZ7-like [Solanum dulcamara]|uniref:protein JAZ7-like n=1 Tax=Solanum dulcamara TaxID=45834 RepID=UPI0024853714|nr:protein JAZ7-like [Solanum dulcamara]